ncbi:MAG TPA: lysophospholipase [Candidatus Dormibacteraeota bacterium]|nr:lysophospholipase [Candidatus Dormibacteraeota bacterium]
MAPDGATATEGFIRSADGTKLAYHAWHVTGAALTFAVVHGMGEHGGRYARFAGGMSKFQMATYAVDLRGHGKSDGQRGYIDSWSQWVDDASAFIERVESEAAGEVVPLGHSFGGVVMLSTVLAGRLRRARRFILSSPALKLKVDIPAWLARTVRLASGVAPRLAISNQVDARTISRIPEDVEAYRTDPLVHGRIAVRTLSEWERAAHRDLEQAGGIKIPFLITAGTADRLIDPAGSEELHRRAPEMSELHLLEGRYHEPFNDVGSDEVYALIADWLRKR